MTCRVLGALLAAVALLVSPTWAADGLQQPSAVQASAYNYDAYFAQEPSPSDVPPAPSVVQPADVAPLASQPSAAPVMADQMMVDPGCGMANSDCGCNSGCNSGCCSIPCGDGFGFRYMLPDGNPCFGWRLPCCNGGPAWKLYEPCCPRWTVGGWLNGGVVTNDHGAANNGAIGFPSSNDVLFNQIYGFIERKANNGGCGWDWGLRVDYLFGADGPDTQAFGDQGMGLWLELWRPKHLPVPDIWLRDSTNVP